ncbi:MAG TPA: hypothetical protein VFX12_01360, partial [Vicinamibacterales bacterium]|nr:hypothetical protein [Vicinamibacterales bacterium]
MSALPPDKDASLSASGFADGLGRRRLAIDRETGEMLERLVLRPELCAFEQVLRDTAARFEALDDERFARPKLIERDDDGALIVVSEFVPGLRLREALDIAADATLAPGIDAALGLLLELLPAIGSLHAAAGIPHGAIGPGRLLFTPAGQLVILDALYASALGRLQLSPARLWSDLAVAASDHACFDIAADLKQCALAAAALMIGRPLVEAPAGEPLADLRREISEVAQIRGTTVFAAGVERLFNRLLQTPGLPAYGSADEAVLDLRQLLRRDLGIDACRGSLRDFLAQVEAAAAEQAEVDRAEADRVVAEREEERRQDAARVAVAAAEQAIHEAERREQERVQAERRERERLEDEQQERERLEAEQRERERLEAEQRERERLEAERRERERLEAEQRERERLEAEQRERARLEAERRERERLEAEQRERERLEKERLEAERRERERLEAERREKERLEAERREKERLERERLEAERREKERLEAERREKERLEKERLEAERREKERLEAERREKERLEAARREKERLEAERREKE